MAEGLRGLPESLRKVSRNAARTAGIAARDAPKSVEVEATGNGSPAAFTREEELLI
jgi:hypothetical protein